MFIEGAAGNIEAQWDETQDAIGTAVLCHPHPLMGGSMHDGVLQIVSSAFNECSINCLRFNFRSVGSSDGEHDQGVGEIEDLNAIVSWLANERPKQKPWLVGYSFGANVVWQSLSRFRLDQLAGVLLVAPPVGRMSFSTFESLPCPIFAIAGDRDDYVDEQSFRDWANVNTSIISGADHFFSGDSRALISAISNVLENSAS